MSWQNPTRREPEGGFFTQKKGGLEEHWELIGNLQGMRNIIPSTKI